MEVESLRELGQTVYFGNTLVAWVKALLTFALWFTVAPLARAFISRRLRKEIADQPAAFLVSVRKLLDATTSFFTIAVATYLAMRWLRVPAQADRYIDAAILVVVWWQVARWLTEAVRHFVDSRRDRDGAAGEGAASLNILRFVGVLAVWAIAFLMLLTNLGVQIGPLVAGLGIGGIAIALAVQNLLGDLFASLSIALDKPFRVGDVLTVGDERGTVEYIGIKSTRLRAMTGEQIVISNGDLLKSRVRNFSRLAERRADLQLRVAYETSRDLVRELPNVIERAIREEKGVRFDRAHFVRYGDYSLVFEASYVVESAEYAVFLNAQQSINLRLLDEITRRGIALAYPTVRELGPAGPAGGTRAG